MHYVCNLIYVVISYTVSENVQYPYVKVKKNWQRVLTTKRVGLSSRCLTPKVQQTCQMHALLPVRELRRKILSGSV